MNEDSDRRKLTDRRKESTRAWTFYAFFGRRRWLRRKSDRESGSPLDRYSPTLFFFVVLILALNVVDSFFTMIIIDLGGRELNPVVQAIMALHGDRFWIYKFLMVSGSLLLLFLHRGYKLLRGIIIVMSSIYLFIVLYQIFLIAHISSTAR
ncbi:MAG: DUF5658 family protein [Thermodesulfobacteriota bacterium]